MALDPCSVQLFDISSISLNEPLFSIWSIRSHAVM